MQSRADTAYSGSAKVCLIIFCNMQIFNSAVGQPVVQYLRGVRRLNNFTLWDYYYYCYTQGAFLAWILNETPVAIFTSGNMKRVATVTEKEFSFVASLVVSRPLSNMLASILIYSTAPSRTWNISCQSRSVRSYVVSNISQKNNLLISSSDSSQNVILQYLFSHSIDKVTRLYMYICAVNSALPMWLTTAQIFGVEKKIVGDSKLFLSDDGTVVDHQAILIGANHDSFVSVLLRTGSGTNVTCLGNMLARTTILYNDIISNEATTTTETITAASTHSSSTSTEVNATKFYSTAFSSTQGIDPLISITSTIPIVIAVSVSVLIFMLVKFRKKKKLRGNRTESKTNFVEACSLQEMSSPGSPTEKLDAISSSA